MKFNHIALALSLTASFGLLACGDDSSADAGQIEKNAKLGEEMAELSQKMNTMTSEESKAQQEFGTCDEENEGKTKTATIADKKYTFTCEDDSWESEEYNSDLEKLYEDMEKATGEMIGNNVKSSGCNFKVSDDKWSYDFSSGNTKFSLEVKFKGNEYTITSTEESSGKEVAMACAYAKEKSSGDTKVSCNGDKMTVVEEQKDEIDDESDRKDLFNEVMGECQATNGNLSWKPEPDDEDEDDVTPSKDNDNDEPAKPAKEDKKKDDGQPSCDFSKDDNVWNYSYASDESNTEYTYKWTSDTDLEIIVSSKSETGDESLCKLLAESTGETAHCEGSLFVMDISEKTSDVSKDETFDQALSKCKSLAED